MNSSLTFYPSRDCFKISDSGDITINNYGKDNIGVINGSSTLLKNSSSISSPIISEGVQPINEVNTPHLDISGKLVYHKNNFTNLVDNGTIRLKIKKKECINDYAYQNFPVYNGISTPGGNSVTIKSTTNANVSTETYYVSIYEDDTVLDIVNKLNEEIVESQGIMERMYYFEPFENGIRLRSRYNEGIEVHSRVEVTDGFIMNDFTRMKPSYFCAPENDTVIFELSENNELMPNNNLIRLIHKADDGKLYIEMYDETSTYRFYKALCDWNWRNEEFCEIEIDFDSSTTYVFIDGKITGMFETVGVGDDEYDVENIRRNPLGPQTYLKLIGEYNGIQGDEYCYAQIAIFNQKQHCGSYVPKDILSYDGSYYIEYNYGQLTAYDDKDITITLSEGHDIDSYLFTMYDGTDIMTSADSLSTFIQNVKSIDYDPNSTVSFESTSEVKFRIKFLSGNDSFRRLEFFAGTPIDNGNGYGFDDIYDFIRRYLGKNNVPVELTDDQLYDCVSYAVYEYNKRRNFNEGLQIESLNNGSEVSEENLRQGYSEKEGKYYILPVNIAESDVIDLIFQPRFSTCWFGSGDSFMNNIMAQTLFGIDANIAQSSADYFIWRGTCNDVSNIIGSQISWRIYNNHIYITPNNLPELDQFKVGIRYRKPLSMLEISNSWQIKNLALGRAMIVLGNTRSTFGNQLSTGDLTLTLNGDSLITQGQNLIDNTLTELKKEQKPLFWFIT